MVSPIVNFFRLSVKAATVFMLLLVPGVTSAGSTPSIPKATKKSLRELPKLDLEPQLKLLPNGAYVLGSPSFTLPQVSYQNFKGPMPDFVCSEIVTGPYCTVPQGHDLLEGIRSSVESFTLPSDNIASGHVHEYWARDYFPIFVQDPASGDRRMVLTLHGTGKAWSATSPLDQNPYVVTSRGVANALGPRLGTDITVSERFDFVFEGGNMLSDGRGTCFTTTYAITSNLPQTDPSYRKKNVLIADLDPEDVERISNTMEEIFSCQRIIFLTAFDGNGTNHIDMLISVTGPNTVVFNTTDELIEDHNWDDEIAELQQKIRAQNFEELLKSGYEVHLLGRPTAFHTYANILVTSDKVFVPQYTGRLETKIEFASGSESQFNKIETEAQLMEYYNRKAVDLYRALFPNHEIVGVPSDITLFLQGSFRCATAKCPPVSLPVQSPETNGPFICDPPDPFRDIFTFRLVDQIPPGHQKFKE